MLLRRLTRLSCVVPVVIARSSAYLFSGIHSTSLVAMSGGKSGSLDRNLEFSFSEGYSNVIGVDEAGRGPLAGPVVVAACYIPRSMTSRLDAVIQDSKKMTEEQREEGYKVLLSEPDIKYAVSVVSHTEIDELNILQASLTGMRRATISLLEILEKEYAANQKPAKGKATPPKWDSSEYLALVDGNKVPTEMPVECKAIVKGDSRIFSIAAASIIAKVVRDHLMVDLHKEYPQYNFAQHKGYPTAEHRSLVMRYGPCPYHRRSYGPVKLALEAMERRSRKTDDESNSSDPREEEAPTSRKRKAATAAEDIVQGKRSASSTKETKQKRESKTVAGDKATKATKTAKIPATSEGEHASLRRSVRLRSQKST
jgi:ribonuclease HII